VFLKRVKRDRIENTNMLRENRKKILIPLIIILVSLTFHGFFIMSYNSDNNSFKKYTSAAELLNGNQLPKERLIDFSPFYLYFHLFINRSGLDPVTTTIILQMILIALSAMLIYLLSSLFFNGYMGIVASFIFILSREVLVYEKVLEPEAFMIFFLIAFVYFFSLFALKRGNSLKNLFISSLFFSLTLITRANLFILILILPFYIFFKSLKQNSIKKKSFLNSAVFLIPIIITVSLLWIRNYSINGSFLPYYQNPGYIMFEGNNPNSTGQSAIYPPLVDEMSVEFKNIPDVHHQIYRDFARKITGKNLSIAEINNFWSGKAKNFIYDHPQRFVKLLITKVYFFFHNYARHDLGNSYKWDKFIGRKFILFFPFYIISILAIIGMFFNIKRLKDMFVLYLVFFTQFGIMLVGYVSSRQRVAVISVIIFFAVSAIFALLKNRKRSILLMLIILVGFFFLGKKNDLMKEEDFLWNVYGKSYNFWVRARVERNNNNIKKAEEFAERAIVETPWLIEDRIPASIPLTKEQFALKALALNKDSEKLDFSEKYNLAILFKEAGRLDESYSIFNSLDKKGYTFKRDFDYSSQPLFCMGTIEEKRGNIKSAVKLYKRALKKSPGSPYSLSKLYVLTGNRIYYNKLLRYFDKFDADYFTGMDFFKAGDYKNAISKLLYVTGKLPEFRKALIYLAVAFSRSGNSITAYGLYYSAMKKRMDPVIFKNDIKKIFKNRVEKEPLNPVAYYYYGIVLEQCGLFSEAKEMLLKGLNLKPGNKLFLKRIKIINGFL